MKAMNQDQLSDIFDKCVGASSPEEPMEMAWNAATFESSDCLWNIETDTMWVRRGATGLWVEVPEIDADKRSKSRTRGKRNRGR